MSKQITAEQKEAQLMSFMKAFCEKHNCQMFLVVASVSPVVDANGNAKVDLMSRSMIHDDLMPQVSKLVEMQIAEINLQRKIANTPKIIN